MINQLYQIICDRRDRPRADSYVSSLLNGDGDPILQKIGEESLEVILAAKNLNLKECDSAPAETTAALIHEIADLTFHVMVLMAQQKIPPAAVADELKRRFGISGLTEKAGRKS